MQLILPEEKYCPSYAEAAREYRLAGITRYSFKELPTQQLLADFEDARIGRNLKPGRVPATYLWLVEGEEFLGEVSIRHALNDALLRYGGHIGYGVRHTRWNQGLGTHMLRLALLYAREQLGLQRVLLTCDDDNPASARVMEKNGGVLQDRIVNLIDGREILTRRYWIG